MKKLRPPVKTHGGKYYLASWIIDHFPADYEDRIYVEPYCGGASVLLQKKRSWAECIGDIDQGLIHLLTTIRDEPSILINRLRRTRYRQATFEEAQERAKSSFDNPLDHGTNEFILRRMSRGGLKKAYGWSNRLRGGIPGDLNAWNSAIDLIPLISNRLQGVRIVCQPALQTIEELNCIKGLVYADPPYMPETRTSKGVFEHEMDEEAHLALARTLLGYKGRVMISGYPSRLYDTEWYFFWDRVQKEVANNASQQRKKNKKIECIWRNFTSG